MSLQQLSSIRHQLRMLPLLRRLHGLRVGRLRVLLSLLLPLQQELLWLLTWQDRLRLLLLLPTVGCTLTPAGRPFPDIVVVIMSAVSDYNHLGFWLLLLLLRSVLLALTPWTLWGSRRQGRLHGPTHVSAPVLLLCGSGALQLFRCWYMLLLMLVLVLLLFTRHRRQPQDRCQLLAPGKVSRLSSANSCGIRATPP